MKPFFWKIVICLLPNILAAWAVWHATTQYFAGEGGFKLGVDLVGGTELVYEIDATKMNLDNRTAGQGRGDPKELAAYLKRRIDPNDLYNITVRMVGDTRVEIVLPTGGKYRAEKAKAAWDEVIKQVEKEWGEKIKDPTARADAFSVGQGKVTELAERIQKAIEQERWPLLLKKPDIWKQFKQIAKDWEIPDAEIEKIPPGDYQALVKRLQGYPNAVKEITGKAQSEAWTQTVLMVKEKFLPKGELDPKAFTSENRDTLVRYIQSQGNGFTGEVLDTSDSVLGTELTPKGGPSAKEINDFINATYGPSTDAILAYINQYYKASERRDVTAEEINRIKELISHVGRLEFLILANNKDDEAGAQAAEAYLSQHRDELEKDAKQGLAPPGPLDPDGKPRFFSITFTNGDTGRVSYSWVELNWRYRKQLGLSNKFEAMGGGNWQTAAKARREGKIARIPDNQGRGESNGELFIYSRVCQNQNLTEEQRREKKFDYFILVRDPEIDTTGAYVGKGQPMSITGEYLAGESAGQGSDMRPVVNFQFNNVGARMFRLLTSENVPSGSEGASFKRHLAIVLDGEVMTAPTINSVIEDRGQISGDFTAEEVNRYVTILRSGALPATLKPQPVSENTIGATLGQDAIDAGVLSVGIAFAAILIFMAVYYRFAGLVACTALLSNLLLTVGFMVAVGATFTLPGLAGLVLMIGMAVDANVLIYERLREERDRGASLALAIRNGYDRAFPTIIDTHLSSIFTAIVLYVVGNDQLKGFGVSLTVGLVISLFTSLYMTRLIFDLWQSRGWLKKLGMFRLFSRPNINFMAIRYYWFTATIVLTIVGVSVFLARGQQGLSIDFVGGTAYTGNLKQPMDLGQLRSYFTEGQERNRLAVDNVKQTDSEGHEFQITYHEPLGSDKTRTVYINKANGTTPAEREADIKRRAEAGLPDLSITQVFLSSDKSATGDRSKVFTITTVEREVQLVQVSIDRLLRGGAKDNWKSLLEKHYMTFEPIVTPHSKLVSEARIQFWKNPMTEKELASRKPEELDKDRAFDSPSYITTLLSGVVKQDLNPAGAKGTVAATAKDPFTLNGEGKSEESRYQKMIVTFAAPLPLEQVRQIGRQTRDEFDSRPPAERLENFDSGLASKTRGQAITAIVLSWGAILLYLWFRFGSWTFGLAAVCCLIHDLFFTLGIIAFASYLHGTAVGNFLLLEDFKLDFTAVAALLTLIGYSTNDTIVVFDRIREVRGKNPDLTPQMINDSVNQTLSRTLLTSFATWLVVIVLYIFGGGGSLHLFAFIMVVGVIVGTYSSIYIASPLLLIFGEGHKATAGQRQPRPVPSPAT